MVVVLDEFLGGIENVHVGDVLGGVAGQIAQHNVLTLRAAETGISFEDGG